MRITWSPKYTHISLIICVEKEFGIQLNAAEIGELENVGAMINLLEKGTSLINPLNLLSYEPKREYNLNLRIGWNPGKS